MQRRAYVAEVIQQGWTIVSADEGFVIAEVGDRYQITGWFVDGRLGLIDLYDAATNAGTRLSPPWCIPSPATAAETLHRAEG